MCVQEIWLHLLFQLFLFKLSSQANDKVKGYWGEWGPFSQCSATCGPGFMKKERVWIHDPADGEKAQEKWTSIVNFACVDEKYPNCPEDGRWTGWTGWSACTKACGSGIRDRTRECYGQLYGGKDCDGENKQKEDCNPDPCPPLPKKFDLMQCKTDTNFTCESKKMCIPVFQKCDGTVQCHDGSDEMKCSFSRGHHGHIYYDLRRNGGSSNFVSIWWSCFGLVVMKPFFMLIF
ncbi:A disintegrin and metalloproteinase with thrombospondin motifs 7 [Biomphalaria glabrata]|uniref:A disintegrin and metalloproteinase with thrombospondin motifs 7-like n=1 Tax=Biomphalaria glabrata TaxID=6526 RepID=A0A9W2YYZ6_BIOGL|nr:A disintegrin and metalloproteinase with thrombospondin motifs 7-like [Biomphalaria glabrata]KAI8733577.1 A disintegrin and metalloproteinase with thrombospondin motifs 7-like [Biomphalaria glabrata]